MEPELGEITRLLKAVREGQVDARQHLSEKIYAELRKLAAMRMHTERPNHTLAPTALANEAWLKLREHQNDIRNRTHFIALAATAMRHILVDYARFRKAAKRSGGPVVCLDLIDVPAPERDDDLIALDQALERLAAVNARAAQIVEMRHFVGLNHEEIADALGITRRTVDRGWSFARAFLFGEMNAKAVRNPPRR